MSAILIPLVGIVEFNPEDLRKIGMVCVGKVLEKQIPVDLEMWEFFCHMKQVGRFKTPNDFLRLTFGKNPLNPPVKRYEDEGDPFANTGQESKK